jgi:acyl-ACP thioesterase
MAWKNKPFVIDYPVRLNDISVDAKMRSWSVFNYLQDAASCHADHLGVGLKQLRDSDLSWVLSRIRLQMDEFPGYGETVRISTYPSGFDRLFAYRQFVLTSVETGRRLGVAGSAWLTLNPANYRPVSPRRCLFRPSHTFPLYTLRLPRNLISRRLTYVLYRAIMNHKYFAEQTIPKRYIFRIGST